MDTRREETDAERYDRNWSELVQELRLAERRGAEGLRARVRDVLDDRRRVVRLGDQQIEVVEVSAITELLVDDPE